MRTSTLFMAATVLLCACEPKAPPGGVPSAPATPFGDAFQVRFTWAPTVGAVEEAEFRTTMTVNSKVRADGKEQEIKADQGFEFVFSEEALKVDGGAPTEFRRRFSKASITRSGKKETLGVEGQSLLSRLDPDGAWTWSVEGGGRLTEVDYASMGEGLGRRGGGRGKDGRVVDEEFGSGRAVKPGDSWRPDAETIARLYVDSATEIDAAASKLTCTLKSAEKRGGAICGTIDLDFDFCVIKIGGGVLSEPLRFVLKGSVTGCLDGSSPDAEMSATIVMKGRRTVARPGATVSLDVDYDVVIRLDSRRALRK